MSKTSKLTRGGILTALSLLFIYLSNILPTSRLYVLGVSSSFIPISIITTGLKNSLLVYLATALLSLLLVGIKVNVFSYIIFFGSYGFVKYYIEKLRSLPLELFLKLCFFNLCTFIIFQIFGVFFTGVKVKLSVALIIIILQFVFLIYDYALTIFISYMNRHYIKKQPS